MRALVITFMIRIKFETYIVKILFTEAKRFTKEQKDTIDGIKIILGEESLKYMIIVFSHCNKKQTKDPDYFIKSCLNDPIKAFVNSVGGRWAISPDAEKFPPDNLIHKKRLQQLKNHITSLDGTYTFNILEKARKEKEENEKKVRKAEKKRQREYDEILKREKQANDFQDIINIFRKKIESDIYQKIITKF